MSFIPVPILVILTLFLLAYSNANVFLIIYHCPNINLIHASSLEMVNPSKLLQRLFIIFLKYCLLDVFVQVDFLYMLKLCEGKFHDVDRHKLLDHLLVQQKVLLWDIMQRFLEYEVLPILRWLYGLPILLLLLSVVISELQYSLCTVQVEFALCQVDDNYWLSGIIITCCPCFIEAACYSAPDVGLQLGILIINALFRQFILKLSSYFGVVCLYLNVWSFDWRIEVIGICFLSVQIHSLLMQIRQHHYLLGLHAVPISGNVNHSVVSDWL